MRDMSPPRRVVARLKLSSMSNSRCDFSLEIKDLSWCPGPESNRHALRRGILRKRAPLQASKIGHLKAYGILYNVLYNAANKHQLTPPPLYSMAFQAVPSPNKTRLFYGQLGWFGGLDCYTCYLLASRRLHAGLRFFSS